MYSNDGNLFVALYDGYDAQRRLIAALNLNESGYSLALGANDGREVTLHVVPNTHADRLEETIIWRGTYGLGGNIERFVEAAEARPQQFAAWAVEEAHKVLNTLPPTAEQQAVQQMRDVMREHVTESRKIVRGMGC